MVRVGGLIGGSGYGFLIRNYVLDACLMDVNGRILNKKLMGEGLFWTIRGGDVSSLESF